MIDLFAKLFACVCGQHPEHTWALGGLPLPTCQRCTGLYLGALVATLAHLWLRPRLTSRFLAIHCVLLLQMVPFGFHWVPQGPVLRTLTGALFACGVVTFFWLGLAKEKSTAAAVSFLNPIRYVIGLIAGSSPLAAAALGGGRAGAAILSWAALAGLVSLGILVLANLVLGLRGVATRRFELRLRARA